jgi:catechol 2,3-dioxygenase-like lactoylglutathione lyase family enzyme
MLSDARLHTTLPAADLKRARAFYSEKLGLEPTEELPQGLTYEAGAATRFILFPTRSRPSGTHTQIGFAVDDIQAVVNDLKARGAVFEEYDFPGLKTVNSIANTGPIRAAWLKDSEGNLLGIVQLPR